MAAPTAETGAIEPYYTDVQAATANLDLRVEPELIGRIEDWIGEQRACRRASPRRSSICSKRSSMVRMSRKHECGEGNDQAERPAIEPITATVEQFRVISGLSKDSIYKLIRAGDIRSVVICGRRLIDLASYRSLIVRASLHVMPTRGGLGGGK